MASAQREFSVEWAARGVVAGSLAALGPGTSVQTKKALVDKVTNVEAEVGTCRACCADRGLCRVYGEGSVIGGATSLIVYANKQRTRL